MKNHLLSFFVVISISLLLLITTIVSNVDASFPNVSSGTTTELLLKETVSTDTSLMSPQSCRKSRDGIYIACVAMYLQGLTILNVPARFSLQPLAYLEQGTVTGTSINSGDLFDTGQLSTSRFFCANSPTTGSGSGTAAKRKSSIRS